MSIAVCFRFWLPKFALLCFAVLRVSAVHATEVSVLGYHDFTETGQATEMCIPIAKFRQQMQTLRNSKIQVISMADFLAWKRGEKTLPEQAVVITIDDGWKSVYTKAYPILKEFNYPFTVFLYTNYVNVGGRSMDKDMIQEMISNGCSIGSHSISHPYPSQVKKQKRKGRESYLDWLNGEIGDSLAKLKEEFGSDSVVPAYAYPGGFHTPEMFDVGAQQKYQAMFTVIPKMITSDSSDFELPRFIVLGTHDYTFTNALNFSSGIFDPHAPTLFPEPDAHITERNPLFQIQFPKQVPVDPDTIHLNITELGNIALDWDPSEKRASGKLLQPLRSPSYEASLSYKLNDSDELKKMTWTFHLDREVTYSLDIEELPESPNSETKALRDK